MGGVIKERKSRAVFIKPSPERRAVKPLYALNKRRNSLFKKNNLKQLKKRGSIYDYADANSKRG